jgi:hypothetical protein
MLLLDLLWADSAQVGLCLVTAICVVVREIAVESGGVEVMDNVAADTRIVVVGHGASIGGCAVGDERVV